MPDFADFRGDSPLKRSERRIYKKRRLHFFACSHNFRRNISAAESKSYTAKIFCFCGFLAESMGNTSLAFEAWRMKSRSALGQWEATIHWASRCGEWRHAALSARSDCVFPLCLCNGAGFYLLTSYIIRFIKINSILVSFFFLLLFLWCFLSSLVYSMLIFFLFIPLWF